MTNEEQRIEIARACGWVVFSFTNANHVVDGKVICSVTVPDYPNSLDAMHDAEKYLNDKPNKPDEKSQKTFYRENLCIITIMKGGPITSTAAQRAEAFLRTVGKWKE